MPFGPSPWRGPIPPADTSSDLFAPNTPAEPHDDGDHPVLFSRNFSQSTYQGSGKTSQIGGNTAPPPPVFRQQQGNELCIIKEIGQKAGKTWNFLSRRRYWQTFGGNLCFPNEKQRRFFRAAQRPLNQPSGAFGLERLLYREMVTGSGEKPEANALLV